MTEDQYTIHRSSSSVCAVGKTMPFLVACSEEEHIEDYVKDAVNSLETFLNNSYPQPKVKKWLMAYAIPYIETD